MAVWTDKTMTINNREERNQEIVYQNELAIEILNPDVKD